MLKILHTEASDGWGGQEIRIIQESLGMIRRGHRVAIAAPGKSMIFRKTAEAGINVFPASFNKKNPFSVPGMFSLINREDFDIINTHSSSDSWVTAIAARFSKNRPLIIRTRHVSVPISRSFLSRMLYEGLTDAVMTTGEEIREMMIRDNRFDASRVFTVPTGIDLVRFDPSRVKPAFQKKGFSIGMVGVLRSWKGHRYFIEAIPEVIKKIPEALFYIAGAGPQQRNIKSLISGLSLHERVTMLGHREDVPEIMASLDVVVHPSYAHEGIPQSILQALAMKKAVVASDAGAVREVIIDNKTGLLIQPKNSLQLAERLVYLHNNPQLIAGFGDEGRRLVGENHSIGKMLDRIESIYSGLIQKKQGRQ
ncbi:MAG: glycosyltransferase family 4 protein [Nitrospirota bacterium]